MKISFYTLGCKVNRYESQAMAEKMKECGYDTAFDDENADIFVINSCSVTAEADKKTRQAVRKFKRNNPDSVVILTGCMPQAFPGEAKRLEEADIVLGNRNNFELPLLLSEYLEKKERIFSVQEHKAGDPYRNTNISSFDTRTRADIKIQDGCNRFCTYCIIPYSRGRVRSKPIEEIKKELAKINNNGYREVVLVGINLSSYGSDLGVGFPEAVKTACSFDNIERVRLGSLEPDHLTKEIIEELAKCDKLCPQFHISLQSGSDTTLKNMHRHYTVGQYRELCDNLRSTFKNCTLTTDVMVGFPMETWEDFNESLEFVKSIGFEKVHVFPYSSRPGTRAALFEPQIPKCEKEKRAHIMIEETEKIRREFLKNQIDSSALVLFESKTKDGYISGYTENYTPVRVKTNIDLTNEIHKVKITGTENDYCIGIIKED